MGEPAVLIVPLCEGRRPPAETTFSHVPIIGLSGNPEPRPGPRRTEGGSSLHGNLPLLAAVLAARADVGAAGLHAGAHGVDAGQVLALDPDRNHGDHEGEQSNSCRNQEPA